MSRFVRCGRSGRLWTPCFQFRVFRVFRSVTTENSGEKRITTKVAKHAKKEDISFAETDKPNQGEGVHCKIHDYE